MASTGLSFEVFVRRAELPHATKTTSPTPAPTESTAITWLPVDSPEGSIYSTI